jgi:hypothetical protein
MSLRFNDAGHLPATPKSFKYTYNGAEYRIPWSNSVPWGSFYSQVRGFQERNKHPVSTMEEVENYICSQLPSGWCSGAAVYRPQPARPAGGCKSCGRR